MTFRQLPRIRLTRRVVAAYLRARSQARSPVTVCVGIVVAAQRILHMVFLLPAGDIGMSLEIPGGSHAPESPLARQALKGLYDPSNEHDACGVGFVAHVKGKEITRADRSRAQDPETFSHRGATVTIRCWGRCGILIQLPDQHLRRGVRKAGHHTPRHRPLRCRHGVPSARTGLAHGLRTGNRTRIHAEGQILLGWRNVPTNNEGLSPATIAVEPLIRQCLLRAVRLQCRKTTWNANSTSSGKRSGTRSRL